MTLAITAPGDTNLSDATGVDRQTRTQTNTPNDGKQYPLRSAQLVHK